MYSLSNVAFGICSWVRRFACEMNRNRFDVNCLTVPSKAFCYWAFHILNTFSFLHLRIYVFNPSVKIHLKSCTNYVKSMNCFTELLQTTYFYKLDEISTNYIFGHMNKIYSCVLKQPNFTHTYCITDRKNLLKEKIIKERQKSHDGQKKILKLLKKIKSFEDSSLVQCV